ncbi:MAG: RNA-binding domain-containing protein [Bacteroidota bacterium]
MPESHNIEYKANWRDEYLKWICGFANSSGGKLYIGVDDNGKVLGISNHNKLLEDLKTVHRSKPRNTLNADTCFKACYIDSWGRGTIKIIEACKEAGPPEPVLKEEQGGFLSKVFKDRFNKEQLKKIGLNDRQVRAVEHMKKNRRITNQEYQKINNCSRNTASGDLGNLVEKKILKHNDIKGAGSFYELL